MSGGRLALSKVVGERPTSLPSSLLGSLSPSWGHQHRHPHVHSLDPATNSNPARAIFALLSSPGISFSKSLCLQNAGRYTSRMKAGWKLTQTLKTQKFPSILRGCLNMRREASHAAMCFLAAANSLRGLFSPPAPAGNTFHSNLCLGDTARDPEVFVERLLRESPSHGERMGVYSIFLRARGSLSEAL